MSERDIRRLLALVERHLGVSWREVTDWLREQNSIDAIEARLLAGDYAGVVKEVESAAARFAAETHSQFVRAGQAGAEWLDSQPALADKLIRFDAVNPRAVTAARQNQLELVYGMSDEQRANVSSILAERQSLNPRSVARNIRDSIGLNPQQEKALRSYRQALESGDFSNALGRELSSGHSDRTIRRVQGADGQLTERQVETAVARYRENLVTARAEAIARTESTKAVHQGLHESFSQAIERGDVEADQIVREWIAGPRTRYAREQHQEMDGQQRKWNEPFEAPDGTRLMYPGSGPPRHAVNCRCTTATTLNPAQNGG